MSSVRSRLVSYGLVLVGVFGTAYAVAEKLPGHSHSGSATHTHTHPSTTIAGTTTGGTSMGGMDMSAAGAGQLGLESTADGYQLVVSEFSATTLVFEIDHDGTAVRDFVDAHGALAHTILVKRDMTGFQHVHPTLDAAGQWSVSVDLSAPGNWRVIVESQPAGVSSPVALGVDVSVPGGESPVAVPAPSSMGMVDGLMVESVVNSDGLNFTVSPTEGIGPYLGMSAHLIALRVSDLAYVHLHPLNDVPGDYRFDQSLPGPGTYRVFLQFMHNDKVVTVPFTIVQS